MFTGVALLISFKNFSFAIATWLTGTRGLAFSLSQLFDMPSSLSLVISSSGFKVRDMRPCLSLEHLEATVGLFNWCNFNIFISQGIGRPEERKRDGGNVQSVKQPEHIQHMPISS